MQSSIRYETLLSGATPVHPIGFKVAVFIIKGSAHVKIVVLSPTRWIRPIYIAFFTSTMVVQVAGTCAGAAAWRKFEWGKYFPYNTLTQRNSGVVNKRQPCLLSIAKLKQWKSLNPIPPLIFGSTSFSHDIQCRDLLSTEFPQQYFSMHDVKPLDSFLVNKK